MKKVKLGEVTINIDNRRKPLNNLQRIEKSLTKKYPYCGANNIIDFIDEYIFDENEEILCIAEDGGSWGKDEECTYVMNEKCWVNNHAHVLKMKTGVDINYIKLNLDYLDLTSYITGSTRGKLTKSSLEKIELKLPDYHTQISISKRISDIQKLITKKKDQIQKYNELAKSRFNEMFGDPVLNEMGWDKHALKEFGIWKSGGTPKRNEEEFFRGNIPWITSGELEHKYIEDSFEKISEKAIECSSAKIIEKGSLLLGMYDTAGLKSSINTKVMSCNQAIAFAKLDDKITNTIYVYYVIQNLRSMLLNQQRGVRQKNFNLSMIKNISIPLPPLSLQNEFANFVAQVDKSQLAIQKSLEELETLKKSLMQEYFG